MGLLATVGRRIFGANAWGATEGRAFPGGVLPGGVTQGLEAGAGARRLRNFQPGSAHVNTLIALAGRTVTERARWLVRNNAYAINAVDWWGSAVVGAGITPSWTVPDRKLKKALREAWDAWTDEADAEGLTDLYGIMRRAVREMFITGEVFVRLRYRRPEDGLTVPLQLQMLPSEMLDPNDNRGLPNGNRVRQGIEYDRIGRKVAFHFWRVHPSDITEAGAGSGQKTVVPAAEVLHLLDPVEAGQTRGLSRFANVMVQLFTLDQYDDAELERKKTAAMFSGFIKRKSTAIDVTDPEVRTAPRCWPTSTASSASPTDRATATIGRVRDSLETTLEPTRQISAAFGRLSDVSGLARVGGWMGAVAGQATSAARTMASAAFPLATGGLVAGGAALAANFAVTSRGLLEGARSLGVSVEDLGAFRNAARLAGLGADEAQAGLESFDKALTDAAFGRNPAAVAASQMDLLGFAIRDGEGKIRSGADALGDLADAYAKLNHDPNAQAEFARIWGVEALDKFLRRGREGVAELQRQGRARGVTTEEQARQGAHLSEQWNSLTVSADRLSTMVGIGMTPALGRATTAMDDLSRADGQWLGEMLGGGIEQGVTELKGLVTTVREIYSEYERLSQNPWFRWFFDMDKSSGGNGRWWNPFGPIGTLPEDQRVAAPEAPDRATELQRMGEQRSLWAAIMSGQAVGPERVTGMAPGPARRRAQDNIEPGPAPQDLLGLIGRSEGTDRGRGYNETLGYGAYTNGPQNLTGMTVAQVDQLQSQMLRHPANNLNSSAVGRYQIVQSTMRGLTRDLGLNGTEQFDQAMQDRMATALAERRGLREYQQGRITREQFQARLAKEWASIPDPRTGQGAYEGQRRPGADQSTINDVLEKERRGPPAAVARNGQAAPATSSATPAAAAPPTATIAPPAAASPATATAPTAAPPAVPPSGPSPPPNQPPAPAADGSAAPPLALLPSTQGGRLAVDMRFSNTPPGTTINARAEGDIEVGEVRVEHGMMGMADA